MDLYEEGSGEGSGSSNECVGACMIDGNVLKTLPVTLVSSLLSIIGSLLIIAPFVMWADIRKSNVRRLLLLLAIADLLTAITFLAAVIRHYMFILSSQVRREDCVLTSLKIRNDSNYLTFCKGQAFATVYCQCVSFFLTAFIAIYFFIILVFRKPRVASKLMIPFCLISWGVPLVICGYVLSRHMFGITDSRSSVGWCFIDNSFLVNSSETNREELITTYFMFEAFAEKFWEILTFLVIISSYLSILLLNRCKYRKKYNLNKAPVTGDSHSTTGLLVSEDDPGQWNTAHASINSTVQYSNKGPAVKGKRHMVEALSKTDMRLALVPLVFLLLRVWGMIRYIVSISLDGCHINHHEEVIFFCINKQCFDILYSKVLLYLHAFGEPAQGFGNCILFVFFSKPIITRLCNPLIKYCKKKRKKRVPLRRSPSPLETKESTMSRVIVTYRPKPVTNDNNDDNNNNNKNNNNN